MIQMFAQIMPYAKLKLSREPNDNEVNYLGEGAPPILIVNTTFGVLVEMLLIPSLFYPGVSKILS
jgi:hypothetical protein